MNSRGFTSRSVRPIRRRALVQHAVVGLVCLTVGACAPATQSNVREGHLSIERLYSLPHLIGTAPSGFEWSRDSARLAFLWNDEGYNFRDVWIVDVGEKPSSPARWSDFESVLAEPPSAEATDPVAAAEAEERRELDGGVSTALFHPDGEQVLALLDGDLWSLREGASPTPLLERVGAPAFSDDGSRLGFLRDGDLWIAETEDLAGSQRRLTRLARDAVRVGSFSWSAAETLAIVELDASSVPIRSIPDYLTEEPILHRFRRAYPGDEAVRQRVGVVEPGSGRLRWVELASPSPDMILSVRWSPDGSQIAVDTADLYAKDRRIYIVDDGGRGAVREVVREADAENETFYFWRIEWSSDGESLYFLSDRETDYHVWRVDPGGSEATQLTEGEWAVAEMFPTPGGLVVQGNGGLEGRAEERHIYDVSDGQSQRLSVLAGTHTPTVSPDGHWAAVAHSADDSPPDLFLTALGPQLRAETIEHQVTLSPTEEFQEYTWVAPSYVTFESHVDGTTLHGRLTLPPNFDPSRSYPAILGSVYTDSVRNQWGGRTAHPTWGLDQFLAQEGYVLLNVDMRGSWGRGKSHRRGIRLDYGGMDIEDLESGVRYLETLGYVDMERVGIWGSSYGGLMTTMSLFRKPGLYAAGIAGAPATNVGHALTGQMAVMMRPEDQPEEYADSSPYLHAHGLEEPLMIIHGMRDRIVLYKDSVVLTQRLLLLGKDVDLVTLPNAGHGWDNEGLAQTRFAFHKMVDFFDRHLKVELPKKLGGSS